MGTSLASPEPLSMAFAILTLPNTKRVSCVRDVCSFRSVGSPFQSAAFVGSSTQARRASICASRSAIVRSFLAAWAGQAAPLEPRMGVTASFHFLSCFFHASIGGGAGAFFGFALDPFAAGAGAGDGSLAFASASAIFCSIAAIFGRIVAALSRLDFFGRFLITTPAVFASVQFFSFLVICVFI